MKKKLKSDAVILFLFVCFALTELFELQEAHFLQIQSPCGPRQHLSSMTPVYQTAPPLDG